MSKYNLDHIAEQVTAYIMRCNLLARTSLIWFPEQLPMR